MINSVFERLGTEPSVIRKIFAYGLEQAKKIGAENVYDYTLGNPSIPSPASVNETIRRLTETVDSLHLHGYSMAPGFEEARVAVAKNMTKKFGREVLPNELFFTCGAAAALISSIKALSFDGAEVLVLAPFFPEYRPFIEANGAKMVLVPADKETFQIHADEVEARITKNTQAVIINSPNNPSGVVFSKETIAALGAVLERKSREIGHPIYILSDEPYRELVYDGVKVPFIPGIYRNTVICYSWSKSLSMPGERIGYVYVPSDIDDSADFFAAVAGASRIMGHVCPPSLMQRVVAECCAEDPDLEAYDRNRKLLYTSLTEMGYECVKPQGAFYMFVKAPNGDGDAWVEKAMKEYNLLAVPAAGFGCADYFRLAYCVKTEMIERSLPAFRALIREFR